MPSSGREIADQPLTINRKKPSKHRGHTRRSKNLQKKKKKNSLPPHITLFILTHIETHKPSNLFNRMKWMLLTFFMGKIKEVTMKIVLNCKYWDESQLEVYIHHYE
jgi:hypothetical protein